MSDEKKIECKKKQLHHVQHFVIDHNNYVKVYIENINPDYLSQFDKYDTNDVMDFNLPYDVNSIMQYPSYVFKKSGAIGPPMKVVDPSNPFPPYGTDRRLSPMDVIAVHRLYQCSS